MAHPYPYSIFCFVLGFLLVFRTNLAYNRYSAAVLHVAFMTSKWGDAALQVHNFQGHLKSKRNIRHLRRQSLIRSLASTA